VTRGAVEGTELAIDCTDICVIHIPIDKIGYLVAWDSLSTHFETSEEKIVLVGFVVK
jgi:hypothetical protein